MKKALAFVLAVAMAVSLGTCFAVNTSATALAKGNVLEIAKTDTAPDVTDGAVDSSYTKIFDMSGYECWKQTIDPESGYLVWVRNEYAPVDGCSDLGRYDAATNPKRTDAEWYNTRMEGYASWDASHLYFCMVVTSPNVLDNNVSLANDTGNNMWAGDGMSIAVYNATRQGTTEYCFGQVDGVTQAYRYLSNGVTATQKINNAYGWNSGGTAMRVPDGGVYTKENNVVVYEFAFDWAAFGITTQTANFSFPFSVSVNMNDADRRPSAFCGIQVGPGIWSESKADLATYGLQLKLVNEIADHTHTLGNWEVIEDPTEEKTGTKVQKCTVCGEIVNTEVIPMLVVDEAVVNSIQGIINYLGSSAKDPVFFGKNIITLLTERLAAYKANPGENTLKSIISAWDTWSYGGHDAHDVFWTDTLLSYIDMFPKNSSGMSQLAIGAAKRTPAQLMEHIRAIDETLYDGAAPEDYIDGTISTQFIDGDTMSIKAMNEAATAAEACSILYEMIDFCNENCTLKAAKDMYDALDAAKLLATDTTGDAELYALLEEMIAVCDEELASKDQYGYAAYPKAGFVQYRPAGQADSFTEDTVSYSAQFKNLMGDLNEFAVIYAETVSQGLDGLTFEDNGDIVYYENGVKVAKGLVKDAVGNYYFINSSLKAVKDCEYAFGAANANGLLPAGKYTFDADGKMVIKSGLVKDLDGEIRYYENNVPVAKGLVKDAEGNYYFFNSLKKAVKDCMYAFSEKTANGLLSAGKYTFDADGKMVIKSGLVKDSDGEIRYYENNVPVAKGLVKDADGSYYFINSTKKAVKDCEYAFSAAKANGYLQAGRYSFGTDGKIIMD